ncbi:hypothetical protein Tco_1499190 [Tanacetum coccineum]
MPPRQRRQKLIRGIAYTYIATLINLPNAHDQGKGQIPQKDNITTRRINDKKIRKRFPVMSKMHSWTWDELVVSVQCLSSNPSLPLFLLHHLTIHGVFGLCDCQVGKVIGAMGRWEMVRGRLGSVLGVVVLAINHGGGRLKLRQQLSRVHSTFHVSNLKKCLSDEPLTISLDEIHINDKLHFVEELVKIMDHEVKRLKPIRVPIIKVRWKSRRGPEFTWERDDQFRKKYLHLLKKTAPSTSTAS